MVIQIENKNEKIRNNDDTFGSGSILNTFIC